jgi:hypothetical protein
VKESLVYGDKRLLAPLTKLFSKHFSPLLWNLLQACGTNEVSSVDHVESEHADLGGIWFTVCQPRKSLQNLLVTQGAFYFDLGVRFYDTPFNLGF